MKLRHLLPCGLGWAALLAAQAQTPPASEKPAPAIDQPLSEKELMQQLDALGKGDPLTKNPRSAEPAKDTAKPGKDAKDPKGQGNGTTEITAKEASFDQKTHTAVFLKEVFVENPEFTLSCDKLTAFMRQEQKDAAGKPLPAGAPKPAGTPAKPAGTPAPSAPRPASASPGTGAKGGTRVGAGTSGNATLADRTAATTSPEKPAKAPGNSGGLEKAIAEGTVVITQDKVDADGTASHNVGRSKRAVYEASTGDITLTGRPEVQQGINTCIALSESTVMVLNRNGRMTVNGDHKVVIRDPGSAQAPGPSGGSSPSTSPAVPHAR